MSASVLITGANRGIGLGLARDFLARGYRVCASCREPHKADELQALVAAHNGALHVYACDVMSDSSVQELHDAVAQDVDAIDIVVNNAGILPHSDEKIGEVGVDTLRRTFETNTLGPFRIVQAFLPLVRRGQQKKLIHLSSKMGSVSLNEAGGAYSYRMSKAALNSLSRNLALELHGDGIISLVVHPGWAQTDMGGRRAPVPLRDSVQGLMSIIEKATLRQSGRFFNYTGEELAY